MSQETNLSTTTVAPADWRRLDVKMLLVHPVHEVVRFLPLLIGFFFLGNSAEGGGWWHVAGVAIPVALGVLRYVTTSYRIADGQIELRRGLIGRKVLTARLDRVRSVELTASPVHRLLGLAKVQIGTGTSAKAGAEKLELDALSRLRAGAMREELLHRADVATAPVRSTGADAAGSTASNQPVPTPAANPVPSLGAADEVLLRFDPSWTRYAPLTMSGVVIGASGLAVGSQFFSRSIHWDDPGDMLPGISLPLPLLVLAGVVVLLIGVSLLSVAGYLVTNWGFTLSRDPGGRSFHVRKGLFTTHETSLDQDRVRGLDLCQPLGLRLAGAARLSAIVTGLDKRSGGRAALAPASPLAVPSGLAGFLLDDPTGITAELTGHGSRARRRRYLRALEPALAVVALVVLAWLALDWPGWLVWVSLLLPACAIPLARGRCSALGHALTPAYVVVSSGSLNRSRTVLQRQGTIGWNLKQSFFQRRAGLVHLTATCAAGKGGYTALDIPLPDAVALADAAVPGLLDQFLTTS